MIGSQTASLTPSLSFAHNLGCRCPNDTCEAILDIYTSRPFHWYKNHFNARCFDPWTWALNFRESRRTPTSHFWECGLHPHTYPKVGVRHRLKIEGNWITEVYENNSKMTSSTWNACLETANHDVHGSFAWKRFVEGEMATMQQHNIFRPLGWPPKSFVNRQR